MILVMEKCEGNLKSHIFEHPEAVPGKSEDTAVIKEAFRWVQQITDALTFMHNQGVVHGHLKLESIKVRNLRLTLLTVHGSYNCPEAGKQLTILHRLEKWGKNGDIHFSEIKYTVHNGLTFNQTTHPLFPPFLPIYIHPFAHLPTH